MTASEYFTSSTVGADTGGNPGHTGVLYLDGSDPETADRTGMGQPPWTDTSEVLPSTLSATISKQLPSRLHVDVYAFNPTIGDAYCTGALPDYQAIGASAVDIAYYMGQTTFYDDILGAVQISVLTGTTPVSVATQQLAGVVNYNGSLRYVTDASGATTYVQGRDYTVTGGIANNAFAIARVSSGTIPSGSTVRIVFSTRATPSDTDFATYAAAANAAGLGVYLKPHICASQNPNGQVVSNIAPVPGSRQVTDATWTSGGTIIASTAAAWSTADVGSRIGQAYSTTLPNTSLQSGLAGVSDPQYGLNGPKWPTTGVTANDWCYITAVSTLVGGTDAALAANQVRVSQTTTGTASAGQYIHIINDSVAHGWFVDYLSLITHQIDILQANGGCAGINLSTEAWFSTMYFETEWRTIIASLRSSYPKLWIGIGPNGGSQPSAGARAALNGEFTMCAFWDALGWPDGSGGGKGMLGVDFYQSVSTSLTGGYAGASDLDPAWQSGINGHAGWLALMVAAQTAWQAAYPGKTFPWHFMECGYQSVQNCGNTANLVNPTTGYQLDQLYCYQSLVNNAGPVVESLRLWSDSARRA